MWKVVAMHHLRMNPSRVCALAPCVRPCSVCTVCALAPCGLQEVDAASFLPVNIIAPVADLRTMSLFRRSMAPSLLTSPLHQSLCT
jgi:hypothetical protein